MDDYPLYISFGKEMVRNSMRNNADILGKRLLCLALVFVLMITMLTGCGKAEPAKVRIGSLKGPTSIGILPLMEKATSGLANEYSFQIATSADELLPLIVREELDIALIPANVASVLYAKTEGKVLVIDINTLGVLYFVTGNEEVDGIEDLKNKTIYLTGKGTTPEASLRYILKENGFAEGDYQLRFQSEATEVAAILEENPDAVGLLPQPFATVALMQNDSLKIALDLNEEWEKLNQTGMITGVTVVRKAFLEKQPKAVENFLREHAESVKAVQENPKEAAKLAVDHQIVAKEAIALKAIPQCNVTCITGEEMKEMLSGYLEVLVNFKRELVGGSLPGDDFYYIGE